MSMTAALFSNFPQHIMLVLYCWTLEDWADRLSRNVGTELPLLLDCLTLEVGPIGCPETSVRNYHYYWTA